MICPNCKKTISKEDKFCGYCGYKLELEDAGFLKWTRPKESEFLIKPSTADFEKEEAPLNYAGFWIRFGAWFIDLAISTILFLLFFFFILEGRVFWEEGLDRLVDFGILIIYHTFFLSIYSSTPGKMLYGLEVIDVNTEKKVKFGKALGRSLSYIISSIVLSLGFLWVAIDKEKHQGWHDKIAKTLVIKKTKNPLVLPIILSIIAVVFLIWLVFSEEPGYSYLDRDWLPKYGTKQFLISDIKDEVLRRNLSSVVFVNCYDEYFDWWTEGSGVFINSEGYFLTNYHVIEGTDYCDVGIPIDLSRPPDREYYAGPVAYNEILDIALLKIAGAYTTQMPQQFPSVYGIGISDALSINENITLVGYPVFGGYTLTLTDGIVSGRVGDDLIKVSAKIDAGNSGGALFNQRGELVGIATFGVYGEFEGLGYVVGIDSIIEWLETLYE